MPLVTVTVLAALGKYYSCVHVSKCYCKKTTPISTVHRMHVSDIINMCLLLGHMFHY